MKDYRSKSGGYKWVQLLTSVHYQKRSTDETRDADGNVHEGFRFSSRENTSCWESVRGVSWFRNLLLRESKFRERPFILPRVGKKLPNAFRLPLPGQLTPVRNRLFMRKISDVDILLTMNLKTTPKTFILKRAHEFPRNIPSKRTCLEAATLNIAL